MSLYAISDLHLARSVDKPMDIFGDKWAHYMDRLKSSWEETVSAGDTVLIPGDISWGTYLENCFDDFSFIDELPGTKIISKGNHDYWWATVNKMNRFLEEHRFSTIHFLHNNSYIYEDICLCGTRGWKCPGEEQFLAEDEKVYKRELQRMRLSLEEGRKTGQNKIYAVMHYPPFNMKREPSEFVDIMAEYDVKVCIYGHLHGEAFKGAYNGIYKGIEFKLVSADYLGFKPLLLC